MTTSTDHKAAPAAGPRVLSVLLTALLILIGVLTGSTSAAASPARPHVKLNAVTAMANPAPPMLTHPTTSPETQTAPAVIVPTAEGLVGPSNSELILPVGPRGSVSPDHVGSVGGRGPPLVVGAVVAAETGGADIGGARFAQKSYSETFSKGGLFGGQTIDDVAGQLESGALSSKDVPINVVVRDGNTLITNTRSAQALTRAGIPRGSWNVVNQTGNPLYANLLSGQLSRNGLTSSGYEFP